jgi:hypothetical protein
MIANALTTTAFEPHGRKVGFPDKWASAQLLTSAQCAIPGPTRFEKTVKGNRKALQAQLAFAVTDPSIDSKQSTPPSWPSVASH